MCSSGHVYSVIVAAALQGGACLSLLYWCVGDLRKHREPFWMGTVIIKIKLSFKETDLGSYVETLEAS